MTKRTTKDTKTTTTETTTTAKTTTVVKVPRIDLTEVALRHYADDSAFLAPIVGVLCEHGHFVGGLLLGAPEAVCLTMAIAMTQGGITPDEAMTIIRETERDTGSDFGLQSWPEVMERLREIARTLTLSGAAVMDTAVQYEYTKSQQPPLHPTLH